MPTEDLDLYLDAYAEGNLFASENLRAMAMSAQQMVNSLSASGATTLISTGVGHAVVVRVIAEQLARQMTSHTIVEGSQALIDEFKSKGNTPDHVHVVNSMFEDYVSPTKVDAIEMGFILEHVDDPQRIVNRFSEFLKPGGTLFVTVPNARSLHRLVGHAAGLLDDLYELSDFDLEAGHKRYFDLDSLTEVIVRSGLSVQKREGIFVKPVTTAQFNTLKFDETVIRAFFEIGKELPDISNYLYLEATR